MIWVAKVAGSSKSVLLGMSSSSNCYFPRVSITCAEVMWQTTRLDGVKVLAVQSSFGQWASHACPDDWSPSVVSSLLQNIMEIMECLFIPMPWDLLGCVWFSCVHQFVETERIHFGTSDFKSLKVGKLKVEGVECWNGKHVLVPGHSNAICNLLDWWSWLTNAFPSQSFYQQRPR